MSAEDMAEVWASIEKAGSKAASSCGNPLFALVLVSGKSLQIRPDVFDSLALGAAWLTSPKLVDKVARALLDASLAGGNATGAWTWDDLTAEAKETWREKARAAIALPDPDEPCLNCGKIHGSFEPEGPKPEEWKPGDPFPNLGIVDGLRAFSEKLDKLAAEARERAEKPAESAAQEAWREKQGDENAG